MKRLFVKVISKKFIPALIIAASLFTIVPMPSIAGANAIEILSNENTTSVKFTGSTDSELLFDVRVNNPKADKFTLSVETGDGEVLFTKEYKDISFTKKMKLLKGDIGAYIIKIRSVNKDLENTYNVNATTKTVDDVVVTKL